LQLTYDQVWQAVLMAAFLAILLGLARGFAAIIQAEFYLWRSGKKLDAYAKVKREAVTKTVGKGLIDALAGIMLLAVFIFPGILDPDGVSVLTMWMIVFVIMVAALYLLSVHFWRIFDDSQ